MFRLFLQTTSTLLALFVSHVHLVAVETDSRQWLLLTADTAGHVAPCHSCHGEALGGLGRRSSVVEQMRKQHPTILLLDSGNALFGSESLKSNGSVIVAAYNSMRYDAANLSYRDFYLGKEETLALVAKARFECVSANLLHESTGEPLVKPYVVKEVDGQRIAFIGVTQRPAALDTPGIVPSLQKQLSGIRICPPEQALADWLPGAKSSADRVILLYYGTRRGLLPIRRKFADQIDLILTGGGRTDGAPKETQPPIVSTTTQGRHLAVIRTSVACGRKMADIEQHAVGPETQPDSKMRKLLSRYGY